MIIFAQLKKYCLPVLLVSIALVIAVQVSAQQKTIPLNGFFTSEVERAELRDSASTLHISSKPFLENHIDLSRVTGFAKDSVKIYYRPGGKLIRHHLFSVKKDDYFIAIDPLFDFTVAMDFADTTAYADTVTIFNNQRGLQVIGDLGKKFSFQTSFYENQSNLPRYLKEFADTYGVVPGMGRTKPYRFEGYDYAMANGWISYSPTEKINLQFGNGKQFIGNGYRSLLLSDASFSYPYIKATIKLLDGKLQYSAMYASLQTLERLPLGEVPEALFKRKGGSFNYLSFLVTPGIEIGLFEGIVWERYDSSGTRPQHWGAYIPVIGANTGLQGLDGKHNAMLGANARVRLNSHGYVYGQVAMDNADALGYQAGIRYFDLLVKNLDLRFEWNSVGEDMYSSSFPNQSYTHYNQPLGHPTGPSTDEFIIAGNYRYRRFISQLKFNYITHTTGPGGDWRSDPDIIELNIAPWPDMTIQQWDASIGLYLNPKTNLQFLLGFTDRLEITDYNWMEDQKRHTSMLYLSFRTNLIDRYGDF